MILIFVFEKKLFNTTFLLLRYLFLHPIEFHSSPSSQSGPYQMDKQSLPLLDFKTLSQYSVPLKIKSKGAAWSTGHAGSEFWLLLYHLLL